MGLFTTGYSQTGDGDEQDEKKGRKIKLTRKGNPTSRPFLTRLYSMLATLLVTFALIGVVIFLRKTLPDGSRSDFQPALRRDGDLAMQELNGRFDVKGSPIIIFPRPTLSPVVSCTTKDIPAKLIRKYYETICSTTYVTVTPSPLSTTTTVPPRTIAQPPPTSTTNSTSLGDTITTSSNSTSAPPLTTSTSNVPACSTTLINCPSYLPVGVYNDRCLTTYSPENCTIAPVTTTSINSTSSVTILSTSVNSTTAAPTSTNSTTLVTTSTSINSTTAVPTSTNSTTLVTTSTSVNSTTAAPTSTNSTTLVATSTSINSTTVTVAPTNSTTLVPTSTSLNSTATSTTSINSTTVVTSTSINSTTATPSTSSFTSTNSTGVPTTTILSTNSTTAPVTHSPTSINSTSIVSTSTNSTSLTTTASAALTSTNSCLSASSSCSFVRERLNCTTQFVTRSDCLLITVTTNTSTSIPSTTSSSSNSSSVVSFTTTNSTAVSTTAFSSSIVNTTTISTTAVLPTNSSSTIVSTTTSSADITSCLSAAVSCTTLNIIGRWGRRQQSVDCSTTYATRSECLTSSILSTNTSSVPSTTPTITQPPTTTVTTTSWNSCIIPEESCTFFYTSSSQWTWDCVTTGYYTITDDNNEITGCARTSTSSSTSTASTSNLPSFSTPTIGLSSSYANSSFTLSMASVPTLSTTVPVTVTQPSSSSSLTSSSTPSATILSSTVSVIIVIPPSSGPSSTASQPITPQSSTPQSTGSQPTELGPTSSTASTSQLSVAQPVISPTSVSQPTAASQSPASQLTSNSVATSLVVSPSTAQSVTQQSQQSGTGSATSLPVANLVLSSASGTAVTDPTTSQPQPQGSSSGGVTSIQATTAAGSSANPTLLTNSSPTAEHSTVSTLTDAGTISTGPSTVRPIPSSNAESSGVTASGTATHASLALETVATQTATGSGGGGGGGGGGVAEPTSSFAGTLPPQDRAIWPTWQAPKAVLGNYTPMIVARAFMMVLGAFYNQLLTHEPVRQLLSNGGASGAALVGSGLSIAHVGIFAGHLGTAFSAGGFNVDTNYCDVAATPLNLNPCPPRLSVTPWVLDVVVVCLVIQSFVMIHAISKWFHRPGGLSADPTTIAGVAVVMGHPEIEQQFSSFPGEMSRQELKDAIKDQQFRLTTFTTDDGNLKFGIVPAPAKKKSKTRQKDMGFFARLGRSWNRFNDKLQQFHDWRHGKAATDTLFAVFLVTLFALTVAAVTHVDTPQTIFPSATTVAAFNLPGNGAPITLLRIVFALLGVFVSMYWSRLFGDAQTFTPYLPLKTGSAPPNPTILLVRHSNPVTAFVPLLRRKHLAAASVAATGLAAEFLVVALAGLPYRPGQMRGEFLLCGCVAAAILFLMMVQLAVVALWWRRRLPHLPRRPDSIAAVMTYVAGTAMVKDFLRIRGVEEMSVRERDRTVRRLGKTYAYGWRREDEGDAASGSRSGSGGEDNGGTINNGIWVSKQSAVGETGRVRWIVDEVPAEERRSLISERGTSYWA